MELSQVVAAQKGLSRSPHCDETGGIAHVLRLLRSVGAEPEAGAKILDLGCGAGSGVAYLLEQGLDAYGFEIFEFWGAQADLYWGVAHAIGIADRLTAVNEAPYRLPYPTGTFDCIISSEVMEHVDDRPGVFREIARVLKPGGISAHIFPSRTKPLIEGHVGIPVAPLCKSRAWLKAGALLGFRTERQTGMGWREVYRANRAQMEITHYPKRETILAEARGAGLDARFAHADYVARSQTGWTRLKGKSGPLATIAASIALPHMLVLRHAARTISTEPLR